VSCFALACLAYLAAALPSSAIGLLWPSIRISIHQPVGALGVLLALGVAASVVSSVATGRLLSRVGAGTLVALGTALLALALAEEVLASSLTAMAIGFALFGLGSGITDSAANAYATRHFGARRINWMHASYGLGATIGPLAVTVMLGSGLSWRWAYGTMAVALAAVALVLAAARRTWQSPVPPTSAPPTSGAIAAGPAAARQRRPAALFGGMAFAAVENGIEIGAGIWGYVFLTSGRGLSPQAAGAAVSAYWAMMFAGRAAGGPAAQRWGPARILDGAVIGVVAGAALMAVPGPRFLAVAGIMAVGVAAAPIFPLFTLTTPERLGEGNAVAGGGQTAPGRGNAAIATRAVTLQVAASAAGSAALPAGIGLVIGAVGARALAPALLVLGLAMCGVYRLLPHPADVRRRRTRSGRGCCRRDR
jgi:fucose permease